MRACSSVARLALVLAPALGANSLACGQSTVSVTLGQFASYDEFGWSGNRRTNLAVPAGSQILSVQISSGYLFATPPSSGQEAAIAIRMETTTGSAPYAFVNFPSGNYSGHFGPSTRTWNFNPSTYFCNDGVLEVEFYETADDYNAALDADWLGGSLIVTYAPPAQPAGGCCIGEYCESLSQAQCAASGGTWGGAGSACGAVPCTPPGLPVRFDQLNATRRLTFNATANSITPPQTSGESDSYLHPDLSDMDRSIGGSGSLGSASASANATQFSSLHPFTVFGSGAVSANAHGSGNGRGDSSATSSCVPTFTLSRATSASLRWALSAGGTSLTNDSTMRISRGTTTVWTRSATNSTTVGAETLMLEPGNYTITVEASASASAGLDGSAYDRYADASWSIRVRLPNTDCDEDGIPDAAVLRANPELDKNADGLMDRCQCLADITDDELVDGSDLAIVLAQWGLAGAGDVSFDGIVDGNDLAILLASWGPCTP